MSDSLVPMLCATDTVLLVGGSWLAWRRPWRGLGRGALVWAAFAVATAAAYWATTRLVTFDRFALLRAACHALFCVLLPVQLVRASRIRRQAPRTALAMLGLALLGEGCYLWASRVEPFRLEITRERITSPRLRGLDSPVRIAAITDLQPDTIGAYEVSVFDTLVAEQPDLVVFLGDTLCHYSVGFPEQRKLLQAQLARLHPRLGMFAVDGDVDADGAKDIFADTSVQVLIDGRRQLPGVPIDVLGLSRGRSRRTALDAGLVRHLGNDRFCVVLGHAPDYMRSVLDGGLRTDALFLAGHTHGGQVQVPGFGPLITLSSVPRWLAAGGVFRSGDTWLAVSRGIGMERDNAPRIRFWCRPQLLLLELDATR